MRAAVRGPTYLLNASHEMAHGLFAEEADVELVREGAPERRGLPRGSSRAERAPERRVLRHRGRVHEAEHRWVSVQRDEALAELDVRDGMSYDARPLAIDDAEPVAAYTCANSVPEKPRKTPVRLPLRATRSRVLACSAA